MVKTRAMTLAGGESVLSEGLRSVATPSSISVISRSLASLSLKDKKHQQVVVTSSVADESRSLESDLTQLLSETSTKEDEVSEDVDDAYPGQSEFQYECSKSTEIHTVIKQESVSSGAEEWSTVPTSRNKAAGPAPIHVDRPVASWNAFGLRTSN